MTSASPSNSPVPSSVSAPELEPAIHHALQTRQLLPGFRRYLTALPYRVPLSRRECMLIELLNDAVATGYVQPVDEA